MRWLRQLFSRRSTGTHGRPMSYEAGEVRRTDPDFVPPLEGPNAEAQRTLDLARRRSRWLADNHDLIRGARETFVNNIGTHYLEPATGDAELDAQLKDLFWQFAEQCDVGREASLFELQSDAEYDRFAVGEWFAYFPVAPEWRGVPASAAIQLVDTDRLPLTDSWPFLRRRAVDRCTHGVVHDQLGRRTAYQVLNEDPNDLAPWSDTGYREISAFDAMLAVERRRQGQVRGVPWPVAIVRGVRMEDAFSEAAVLSAKAAAMTSLWFKGAVPPKSQVDKWPVDARGRPLFELEPGMIGALPPGVELVNASANQPGPQFVATSELLQRRMAVGLNMGYTAFTRDSSKATFAAQRADSLEDRKSYQRKQKQNFRGLTQPWWRKSVDYWIAAGRVKLSPAHLDRLRTSRAWLYNVVVVYDGWQWVNPAQEAAADAIAVELCITSRQKLAARHGEHWEDILEDEARWIKRRREIWARHRLGEPPASAAITVEERHDNGELEPDDAPYDDQPERRDDQDEDAGERQPQRRRRAPASTAVHIGRRPAGGGSRRA